MYELYKSLKDAGFPQGGNGNWVFDSNGENQVYKPHPSEIYTQFLGDPKDWDDLTAAMAEIWLKKHKK